MAPLSSLCHLSLPRHHPPTQIHTLTSSRLNIQRTPLAPRIRHRLPRKPPDGGRELVVGRERRRRGGRGGIRVGVGGGIGEGALGGEVGRDGLVKVVEARSLDAGGELLEVTARDGQG